LPAKVGSALVEGRRFGPGNPPLLTQGRGKRSWLLVAARRLAEKARGATGSVRGLVISVARGRKRCGEAALLNQGPCPSHDNNVTRKVIEQAEACGAPSSVTQPGAGLPKGGPTPRSRRHSGLTPRTSCVEVVAAAQAAGSGVERSSGARSERSVAEVGERHLSGVIEVSREGHQENAG
jgi:hypothetical protein